MGYAPHSGTEGETATKEITKRAAQPALYIANLAARENLRPRVLSAPHASSTGSSHAQGQPGGVRGF